MLSCNFVQTTQFSFFHFSNFVCLKYFSGFNNLSGAYLILGTGLLCCSLKPLISPATTCTINFCLPNLGKTLLCWYKIKLLRSNLTKEVNNHLIVLLSSKNIHVLMSLRSTPYTNYNPSLTLAWWVLDFVCLHILSILTNLLYLEVQHAFYHASRQHSFPFHFSNFVCLKCFSGFNNLSGAYLILGTGLLCCSLKPPISPLATFTINFCLPNLGKSLLCWYKIKLL